MLDRHVVWSLHFSLHFAGLATDFGLSLASPMAGPAPKNYVFWSLDMHRSVALVSKPLGRPFWEPTEGFPEPFHAIFGALIWSLPQCA